MEPIEQLDIVLPTLNEVTRDIRRDQLGRPTPCAAWTVRDVLGHLVGGLTTVIAAFEQGTPVDTTPRPDLLGDDPAAALGQVTHDLVKVAGQPGAADKAITLPFGDLPAPVLLRFLAFDQLVHTWDLATASGRSVSVPDELVTAITDFAHQTVAPEMRGAEGVFGAEVAVPPGASRLDALIAFAGRQP